MLFVLFQLIVDNNDVMTTAVSALVVKDDVYFFTLDQLDIRHSPLVGFEPRTDQDASLTANVRSLIGMKDNVLKVSNRVKLAVGDGPKLYMGSSIMVDQGGTLDVPSNLVVQEEATLDWCGSVTSLINVTVRSGGAIKVAYSAFTGSNIAHTGDVTMDTLTVDHGGSVVGSTTCQGESQLVDLTLQHLEHVEGFTLDPTYFNLIAGYTDKILHPLNMAANCSVTVTNTNQAMIYNGQVSS